MIILRGEDEESLEDHFFRLRLRRNYNGHCVDDNIDCDKIVIKNKCHIRKYSRYCEKSCGLCISSSSLNPSCEMPENIRGSWTWYEAHTYDTVKLFSLFSICNNSFP